MVKSKNIIATPPGATIKEQLLDRGLNQKEFAVRMNMSEKHISKLINGEVQLTPDVAVRLEMVLGIPAKFWNNLEAIYREKIIKANAENAMDADMELLKKLPFREMVKNGWISDASRPQDRVVILRKFFEVVGLTLIMNSSVTRIACRRLSETEKSDYALIAWAQKAKLEARNIETGPVDLRSLTKIIPEIREMTVMDPEEFCPKLCSMLADCGIALVFLPHIGGSFLHGATFYDGNKIVVGLTVRGKDADKFWFSLFHEFGHILKGHINQPDGTTEEDEMTADLFARDTLIDLEDFQQFTAEKDFSREALSSFAEKNSIDVGIVVGRLQKEGYLSYRQYHGMKTKYNLSA